ncbi:MAG: helix-turn-helix domain-containing protein [Prevotella sp.]|nr:helix-turn-helix domain-containing protein [Candidatus Prevotella equi]
MRTRIKEMAQRRGVTQEELAQRLGISHSAVKQLYLRENKGENITLATLDSIAKALRCEVWQLITSEYEVITTGEGDVLTPDGQRIPIRSLRFCFDSKL